MSEHSGRDLVKSIHQRLVNCARADNEEAQAVFTRFGQERLLYRLSRSPYREEFVLKGALLFRIWEGDLHRPTMDLDLLGFGASDVQRLETVFRDVCDQPVEEDGLLFLADRVRGEPIREEEYQGVRLYLMAMLGKARMPLRVDVGFGDAVMPPPAWAEYPCLLDMPHPVIRAYPKEAVIAEKFHAIVSRGLVNSRLKDFFDIWNLAKHSTFYGDVLSRTMEATFRSRSTRLPQSVPVALTDAFACDPAKQIGWKAFLNRNRLRADDKSLSETASVIAEFLMPPTEALSRGLSFDRVWKAGGPWQAADGEH